MATAEGPLQEQRNTREGAQGARSALLSFGGDRRRSLPSAKWAGGEQRALPNRRVQGEINQRQSQREPRRLRMPKNRGRGKRKTLPEENERSDACHTRDPTLPSRGEVSAPREGRSWGGRVRILLPRRAHLTSRNKKRLLPSLAVSRTLARTFVSDAHRSCRLRAAVSTGLWSSRFIFLHFVRMMMRYWGSAVTCAHKRLARGETFTGFRQDKEYARNL